MKKVEKFDYSLLRNESHFEFHTNAKTIFGRYNAEELGMLALITAYLAAYGDEMNALNQTRGSAITADIMAQEELRDRLYRGFVDAVKSAVNHYDAAISAAAVKLMAILDSLGNVAQRPIDAETAALDKLLTDLATGEYPSLIATLGLGEWLTRLKAENDTFRTLMQSRYAEQTARPTVSMRAARKQTDTAYRAIVFTLDALSLNPDNTQALALIAELNPIAERFSNLVAMQHGRGGSEEKAANGETKPEGESRE